MSQEASYDVYVKRSVDGLGRDEFGPAVAHFVERGNAVALKRRLEARGDTVHVERSTVYGLSEAEKEAWFSDYSLIPEFEPTWDQRVGPENSAFSQKSSGDQPEDTVDAPARLYTRTREASKGSREPWWRRMAR